MTAGTKGVPREARERQILTVAAQVFAEQGYAATSVAAVANRAGISKPLVHTYFGTKEALYLGCVERAGAIVADEIDRVAREGATGLERGLRTLEALFVLLEPHPYLWRLLADAGTSRGGPAGAALAGYTARIVALAEEGVGELLHLRGDDDPLDVSAMTAVWLSIVDSLLGWWLQHPELTAAQMSERAIRLFDVVLGHRRD